MHWILDIGIKKEDASSMYMNVDVPANHGA